MNKSREAVAARGQLDNTVFVFTSDHGDCLGDHHQVYKFSSHYDSVARVPLVLAGPGVKQGYRRPRPTLITSVAPTLAAAWGIPVPADADGSVLRRHFRESRLSAVAR